MKKKKSTLAELGALLGGGHGHGSAWGAALGAPATLRFVTRGSGSSSESWTEIDVELPARYPLAMLVRRHGWFDRAKIDHGEMVDVVLGDPPFDDAFLVEAAPAEIVKLLLEAPVRAQLMVISNFQLSTQTTPQPVLRLAIRGWLEGAPARVAIELVVGIAKRVRDAYAQVEAASQPVLAGSPFRQELDDRPQREAAAARETEVGRIHQLQAKRSRRAAAVVGAIFIGVLLFNVIFFIVLMTR